MGEVVDLTKILEALGKADRAASKTGTAVAAEDAIRQGIETARKEMWASKYGVKEPPPQDFDPNAFNDAYRQGQTGKVDPTPPPPVPDKKTFSQALWEAAGWKDDNEIPVKSTPPSTAPASVIAHPSANEAVVAPSAISDRQTVVDREASQMDRHRLNEAAYMSGSKTYDEYLAEFMKIFPNE